jgi:hypothetical protein
VLLDVPGVNYESLSAVIYVRTKPNQGATIYTFTYYTFLVS